MALKRRDVRLGGDARVLAGFDGVLLGRQTEGVPTHRMQNVAALGALVAGEDVGGGVAFRVANVEARAGWVGEHVEDVKLRRGLAAGHHGFRAVSLSERMTFGNHFAGVPGAKSLLVVPVLLPFGFDQVKRILPAS